MGRRIFDGEPTERDATQVMEVRAAGDSEEIARVSVNVHKLQEVRTREALSESQPRTERRPEGRAKAGRIRLGVNPEGHGPTRQALREVIGHVRSDDPTNAS